MHTLKKNLSTTFRPRHEEVINRITTFPDENPNPVLRVHRDGTILYANEASIPLLKTWETRVGALLTGPMLLRILQAFSSKIPALPLLTRKVRYYKVQNYVIKKQSNLIEGGLWTGKNVSLVIFAAS